MKFIIYIVFLFLLIQIVSAQSLNRLNKYGKRTGKWVTYIDDAKKLKSFEGEFKNGVSTGKCYFYSNDGVLDRREINSFKKMKTTFYYPNGKIKLKGNARLENLPDRVHYYFYGKWKAYNDNGLPVKYYYYEGGKLLKTVYLDKNNKTNDSLIEALNIIDKEFTSHNVNYTDSINTNKNNPSKCAQFKNELRYQDSVSFNEIGKIIINYGYPSKLIAGDACEIPFYILGFAPLSVKENQLNELILAADRGIISWKSLAFFIDKIKISKKEKQIYGTQVYFDKNHKEFLYPIEDEENLNKRRIHVGLEVIEP